MAELTILFEQDALNEEAADREIDLTLLQSTPAQDVFDELGLDDVERFVPGGALDATAFGDGDDDEPVEFDEGSEGWYDPAEGLDWARAALEGLTAGIGQMPAEMREGLQATLGDLVAVLEMAENAESGFHFAVDG